MRFRKALPADSGRIMEIIRQAQARMRQAGSAQWQDGYPALPDIETDIARGRGLVACIPSDRQEKGGLRPTISQAAASQAGGSEATEGCADQTERTTGILETVGNENRIIGYAAILFDGEPAYEAIEGAWLGGPDYAAVHRMALADEALHQGTGTALLCEAMRLARLRGRSSFRIDTARENLPMRRLLAALGFAYRGTVRYASGERMAFEKPLDNEIR